MVEGLRHIVWKIKKYDFKNQFEPQVWWKKLIVSHVEVPQKLK